MARSTGAPMLDIEIHCSDAAEHRRRVERRVADLPGLLLPSWEQVLRRSYEPRDDERLLLDTGRLAVAEAVERCLRAVDRPEAQARPLRDRPSGS